MATIEWACGAAAEDLGTTKGVPHIARLRGCAANTECCEFPHGLRLTLKRVVTSLCYVCFLSGQVPRSSFPLRRHCGLESFRADSAAMLNYFQILVLALIQGACELLPVSSSAHVIAAEKLMGLDPASPEMTMLLVMLHTGTMFAVMVYFWGGWKRDYFSSPGKLRWFAIQIVVATFCTGVIGFGLKLVIEKIFMRGTPHAEIENLFSNLPLIAGALTAVGLLIIYAGWREEKSPRHLEIQPSHSIWIGIVQGICLPF